MSMPIGIGTFLVNCQVFFVAQMLAPQAVGCAEACAPCQVDHRGILYALLKISMLVPLSMRPESAARKSKISARSSGVMPAFRCGAAWRNISVSTAPGLTAHTRMLY